MDEETVKRFFTLKAQEKQEEQDKAQWRLTQAQLRLKAIDHLGGKCIHCGFDDPRALQFDHIEGFGMDDNRTIQQKCFDILANNTAIPLQLLCANCNWIKKDQHKESAAGYRKRMYENMQAARPIFPRKKYL